MNFEAFSKHQNELKTHRTETQSHPSQIPNPIYSNDIAMMKELEALKKLTLDQAFQINALLKEKSQLKKQIQSL